MDSHLVRETRTSCFILCPLTHSRPREALYCAHRTSTFLSCAFCEQEGHLAAPFLPPSLLVSLQGWGLIDLPLRASNEGLLRPRVARAQKIIRIPYALSPPFLRVPPRIPRRNSSPRIRRSFPPFSEPLNFPHILIDSFPSSSALSVAQASGPSSKGKRPGRRWCRARPT